METPNESNSTKKYWKSLQEFQNDPKWREMAEKEFMSSPWFEEDLKGFEKESKGGWARREFLKLMGASVALSSFACIRRPVQKIVPYVKAPPEIVPGIANYYASSWVEAGEGYGLLVKTREGRPIKLEGNPSHPVNKGALSARAQAQLLTIYDPERLQGPRKYSPEDANPFHHTSEPNWADVDKEVMELLKEGGVYLLTSSLGSPSTKAVIEEFSHTHKATHVIWEPLAVENVREGQKNCFGTNVVPRYRFAKAKMIVAIDTDFIGTYLNPVENAREFIKGRAPNKDMNRLICFESILTLTGMNSDFRVRIKPSQQIDVVMGLLYEIIIKNGKTSYGKDLGSFLKNYSEVAKKLGIEAELFQKIAADLWDKKGESIVIAGGLPTQTAHSEELQIAVNFLNYVLGNDGATIDHDKTPHRSYEGSHIAIDELIRKMNAGAVKTLLVHRVNPVYSMPKDAAFAEALSKVKTIIYFGDRKDETGKTARYILPDHHHLENWGDAELQDGVVSIQQPTIRPLYDTRAFQDSLLKWSGNKTNWFEYLKARFKKNSSGDFDKYWINVLQEGVVDHSNHKRDESSHSRSFKMGSLEKLKNLKVTANSEFELVLYPTVGQGDGSMANVSWLQEFPDPVTKIAWDNYVSMSPVTAKKLSYEEGSMVRVRVGGEHLDLPIQIQPGVHDGVIGVAVGYGRTDAGTVGNNVGGNAFKLANFNRGKPVFSGLRATVETIGGMYPLANTQHHQDMEGRQIVVQSTLNQYLKKADAGIHHHEIFSAWQPYEYPTYKWGMSIDLSKCTGCGACVIACQAENNIPVVGKKYVLQGREMQWMRIDRYYTGEPENPDTVVQPMLCQHCENAPCETVCPVAATTHSPDGLNEMTYNRCVGTRYCSNNCPYKVRRFNWFNYSKVQEPLTMAMNPDVTVRSRGVMEKCTFCIHRIKDAKNIAVKRGDKVKDGEITTACEQSCPTQAIVFGDMNDPKTRVSILQKDHRSYGVLEEFNVRPSIKYMTRIKNKMKEPTMLEEAEGKEEEGLSGGGEK